MSIATALLKRPGRVRMLLPLAMAVWIVAGVALAGTANMPDAGHDPAPLAFTPQDPANQQGAYCGLYCLYAATKLLNRELAFTELAKPEYVDPLSGSSLAQLELAAAAQDLHSVALERITPSLLKSLNLPVILHVRSATGDETYNHFVLYVRHEGGNAVVYDPPSSTRSIPFPNLLTQMDGIGLVIADQPIEASALTWPETRWRLFLCACVCLVAVALGLVLSAGRARVPRQSEPSMLCTGK